MLNPQLKQFHNGVRREADLHAAVPSKNGGSERDSPSQGICETASTPASGQGSSNMDCKATKTYLTDLLLDPAAASPAAREHVAACADCAKELRELHATMLAMDAWEAPEPSPYFDTRLQARLREEKANPPAGFWERMRARLLYSSNLHMRPVAAGALALLLLTGGGTAFWMDHAMQPAVPQESATVHDLQLLDGNAQVYQQLNSLDADIDDSGNPSTN